MKPNEAIVNIEYARKWLGSESGFSDEALDMSVSALKKQEQDRWIPVTEAQPKKSDEYFVTIVYCGKKYVDICKFIVCDNNDSFWTYQNVIAWRPLPEPYTEEKE